MDVLVKLSWRVYPTTAVMALGVVVWLLRCRLAFRGLRRQSSD